MAELILFRGRPGVGKTTISDLLSAKLNIPIIRKDDFYDIIAEYNPDHEQRNRMSYGILYQLLETNSRVDQSLVLDFPFNKQEDMDRFKNWLQERGYMLKSILCVCSNEAIWAERFNQRQLNPLPNQLITDFQKLKQHYGDLRIEPMPDELVVDTVEPLETILERITSYIEGPTLAYFTCHNSSNIPQ